MRTYVPVRGTYVRTVYVDLRLRSGKKNSDQARARMGAATAMLAVRKREAQLAARARERAAAIEIKESAGKPIMKAAAGDVL